MGLEQSGASDFLEFDPLNAVLVIARVTGGILGEEGDSVNQ